MKRGLLVAFTLLSFSVGAQQQQQFPIHAGFRVLAGGTYSLVKLESYENFLPTYNAANAGRLKSPLGNLRPGAGWCMGVEGYIGFVYFNYMQNYSTATAVAKLKNGDSREFKLIYRPLNMNIDLMIPGKKVDFGMALAMEIQKGRIYSGYRYNNGMLSYAEDQALNGIYRFRGNTRLNLGLRMDFKITKWMHLSVRAERIGFWSKMLESSTLSYNLLPHQDEMMANASSGPINIDGTLHYYLPEDVQNANNDDVYFVGNGGYTFANTYKGWRFGLLLRFNLVDWNLDKNSK